MPTPEIQHGGDVLIRARGLIRDILARLVAAVTLPGSA